MHTGKSITIEELVTAARVYALTAYYVGQATREKRGEDGGQS